jgi:hypothetical protein
MKLNDAISAYDFLTRLDWFGIAGLLIAASLVITYFVVCIIDKLVENKKAKQIIALLTAISINLCICILKIEADRNNKMLTEAERVKNYMLLNNIKSLEFTELYDTGYLPSTAACSLNGKNCDEEGKNELRKIIENFPDDFIEEDMPGLNNSPVPREFLELINQTALKTYNAYNDQLLPLLKEKIVDFIKVSHKDTLNYKYIADNIDTRCDENTLDKIVSRNSKLFISIYAPYNVYNLSKNDTDFSEALKINPDSVKWKKFDRNNKKAKPDVKYLKLDMPKG